MNKLKLPSLLIISNLFLPLLLSNAPAPYPIPSQIEAELINNKNITLKIFNPSNDDDSTIIEVINNSTYLITNITLNSPTLDKLVLFGEFNKAHSVAYCEQIIKNSSQYDIKLNRELLIEEVNAINDNEFNVYGYDIYTLHSGIKNPLVKVDNILIEDNIAVTECNVSYQFCNDEEYKLYGALVTYKQDNNFYVTTINSNIEAHSIVDFTNLNLRLLGDYSSKLDINSADFTFFPAKFNDYYYEDHHYNRNAMGGIIAAYVVGGILITGSLIYASYYIYKKIKYRL